MNGKSIVIATDGSQASKIAFYQAVEFFEFANLFDKIIVSHVSDDRKTYLPFEFQSNTILEDYRIELLSRYPEAKYDLVFEERKPEQGVRDQIIRIAERADAAYLIVGFHGRKGVKQDVSVLGQTLRNAIYNCHIPMIVTKSLYKRSETNGFRFLVCVDGSKKSYQALAIAIQLSFDQRDHLKICFAPTPDSEQFGKIIRTKVNDHMANIQRKWEYQQIDMTYKNTEAILELINNTDVDFVVFGSNGYRAQLEHKQFIGSTSDTLLKYAKANLVVVP